MHEQQPTQEAEHTQVEKWHAPLTRPSFFSKHFAVVIFIILPFIGFYLGAMYAFENIVEMEEVNDNQIKEVKVNNESVKNVLDWKLYKNEEYGFQFYYSNDWKLDTTNNVNLSKEF